jgi:uncharacterized protein YbjT (DUF2867 family)
MRILITGATGNIGKPLIHALRKRTHQHTILLAQHERDPQPNEVHFDFFNSKTWSSALSQTDILFLLRPPQIANINTVFKPLIQQAISSNIKHIVFLSVQGADKQLYIPHAKIEKLIRAAGIPYTFLRPAYFMQNFTTTFLDDIVQHNQILIPAGKVPFAVVDVDDIAEVAAEVLLHTERFVNKAIDITGSENLTFAQIVGIIGDARQKLVSYKSPSPFRYFIHKRKQGHSMMYILVLIMLHYLPRFRPAPSISTAVKEITGRNPVSFNTFALANARLFLNGR